MVRVYGMEEMEVVFNLYKGPEARAGSEVVSVSTPLWNDSGEF